MAGKAQAVINTAELPVMIFSAGFGTRMRHLTQDCPKPLIKVAGQTLLDRTIALCRDAGVTKMVTNTHYLASMITNHLAGQPVEVLHESPDILDTGGGLKNAATALGHEVVGTINPDAVWCGPNPIALLARNWDPSKMDALLACVHIDQVHGRVGGGDFQVEPDNRILRSGDYVYGGAQILKMEAVTSMKDTVFSLNAVWNRLGAENRLYAQKIPGQWCDVGSPEGLALAEDLIARNV